MDVNVLIVHGAYGEPKGNWFPWLKGELEETGIKTCVPAFPTPKGQNLDNWLTVLQEYTPYINEKTILVGHSLGPAFILNVLESLEHPVLAAFLVSGFTGLLGLPEFDDINRTITDRDFDYSRIRRNCNRFFVYNSDNDPYVPIDKGRQLAKDLGGKFTVVKNGGHINAESGHTQLPLVLRDIKACLKDLGDLV